MMAMPPDRIETSKKVSSVRKVRMMPKRSVSKLATDKVETSNRALIAFGNGAADLPRDRELVD